MSQSLLQILADFSLTGTAYQGDLWHGKPFTKETNIALELQGDIIPSSY